MPSIFIAGAEDPTGRIVTFNDGTWGTVVAHRDPISFVLVAANSSIDNFACFLMTKKLIVIHGALIKRRWIIVLMIFIENQ